MHEPGCIAEILSSKEPLSFDEKLLFAKHLLTLCRRDYDKIFLPNERLLVSLIYSIVMNVQLGV